jgi:hypothetical protein
MPAKKRASHRVIGSNLAQVDAHVIQPHEYDEIPELTDEMLARAVWKKGGARCPRILAYRYHCACRSMCSHDGARRDPDGRREWWNDCGRCDRECGGTATSSGFAGGKELSQG